MSHDASLYPLHAHISSWLVFLPPQQNPSANFLSNSLRVQPKLLDLSHRPTLRLRMLIEIRHNALPAGAHRRLFMGRHRTAPLLDIDDLLMFLEVVEQQTLLQVREPVQLLVGGRSLGSSDGVRFALLGRRRCRCCCRSCPGDILFCVVRLRFGLAGHFVKENPAADNIWEKRYLELRGPPIGILGYFSSMHQANCCCFIVFFLRQIKWTQ